MKAAQYTYISRFIDSLLQSVKLINWKNPEMLKFTSIFKYMLNLQKDIKI